MDNHTTMPNNYTPTRDRTILVILIKRVDMVVLEDTVVHVLIIVVIIPVMETRINIKINIILNKLTLQLNPTWLTASTTSLNVELDMVQISTHTPCNKEMQHTNPTLIPADIQARKTQTNCSNYIKEVNHVSRIPNSRVMDYKEAFQILPTRILTMLLREVGIILGGLRLIGKEIK